MKKNAFTLIEILAVMAVMSILVLIILPVMRNVLYDFEQKSNKQVYEQLYKSAKLYYAEKRTTVNKLAWHSPYINSVVQVGETALPDDADLYEKTWDSAPTYFAANLDWSCISTELLVEEGYIKKINLNDVKNRLELSGTVYILLIGEVQSGDKRLVRIKDNALITTISPAECKTVTIPE